MKQKTLATCTLLFIAMGHLAAAQVTFTSGTPALAADVNANFTELYNAKWTRTGADLGYSTGNVGIGIASPAGKLDVIGTKASVGTYDNNILNVYDDTALAANTGGSIAFFGKYTGPTYTEFANISAYKLNATDGNFSAGLKFNTRNNGSNPATVMTLDNAGNVGIGTTTPANNLEISGSGAQMRLTDTSLTNPIFNFYEGATRTGTLESWNQDILLSTRTAKDLVLRTNSVERVRVLANGNVGIGAPNPNGRLDVRDTSAADGGAIAYFGEDVGGMKVRRLNLGADSDRIGFSLQQSATDYFYWVDNAGLLRWQASLPAAQNSGLVVGDQTSTRDTKQDIADYRQIDAALHNILSAKLHTFRYKNEVIGYKAKAKFHIGFIADEVHPDFMDAFGKTIDQVSVNGMLIASVQRLNQKIESRDAQVVALKQELAKKDARIARLEKMESRLAALEVRLSHVARK